MKHAIKKIRRLVIFKTSEYSEFGITYRGVLSEICHDCLFYTANVFFWQSCWWHVVRLTLFLALFCYSLGKSYRQPATIATRPRAFRHAATEVKNCVADFYPRKKQGFAYGIHQRHNRGLKIGSCRVSTEGHNPDWQLAALKWAGCKRC